MQRSLYTGVSGLSNHQAILDVSANNLANVSTNGFKASRISFATALNQTNFAGAAPTGNVGGTNPRQIGLGVTTSSVDVDMKQGALLSTGKNTDLAIQGNGFFQVSDGTRSYYTRVGNFSFDSNNSLVDLGSGNKVLGNLFGESSDTQPVAFNAPITIPSGASLPSKRTSEITFQGNLSSTSKAIQGESVTSLFPLVDETTKENATESTRLSDLAGFKDAIDPGNAAAATQVRTLNVYGTRMDGVGYTAAVTINPWRDSVSDLVARLNSALVQGSSRFGSVALDNGALVASGQGTGTSFSMFLGDANPTALSANDAALGGAVGYTGGAVGTTVTFEAAVVPGIALPGTNINRMRPLFVMPAIDLSAQAGKSLTVSVQVDGTTVGSMNISAADFSNATSKRTFVPPSMPAVTAASQITYTISGDLDLGGGNTVAYTTAYENQDDLALMITDTDSDSIVDMFDTGSTATNKDPSAWQYSDATNTMFDWYRTRFVPETVTSSIEVYDPLGQKHLIEARMFRNGSKPDPTDSTQNRSSWDMILGVRPGEGAIIDDLVSGIEFDQKGRFTGDYGKTLKGNTLADNGYAGDPSSKTIRIDWNSTGTSSPATIDLGLGDANTVNGLTAFGSRSSATAVRQDGFADGKLDALTVSKTGDIVGLFTNGISKKLAQVQLATFANPAGLTQVGTSLWAESPNSGQSILREAGTGGAGYITAGALEGSNVDIASEFTRLITAQRGFQVNARVIQTTDQVLQELAGLIR